jgi:mannose-1-phosphate guanylyltransferase
LAFVEKPPTAEAEAMVQSGEYLWNTGIFAWRNGLFLERLSQTAPEVATGAEAAALARAEGRQDDFQRAYMALPDMAVDHAVMERTSDLLVVAADFAWSDVGSWTDLSDVLPVDADGNAVQGDVMVLDGGDNVVHSDGPLVALVGVSGLVVVSTGDAILVCPRDRVQEIKLLVAELKRQGRDDLV